MHLKSLEIQGFKSFADKVDFHFTDGVTIIVGPNGSGKSNISDSIRWVLGEQSAKSLRGARMEDIIFSGSDRRRPVGMAEVSMTMDNSDGLFPLDFSEVTVTRRVYRSGDSDFLINKTPCRLRDIHELFMDTGIGKETYSIIGQGKVEEILSARPEERRVLIEEAAGIVKYRSRKQEALRKLADTEQNLSRVGDIITELEAQLEPLAEQAERAKAYQDYHGELVSLEINLMVHQIADQKQRLDQVARQLDNLRRELLSRETSANLAEAKAEELRLEADRLEQQISEAQAEVMALSTAIERAEGELKVGAERAAGLTERLLRLEQESKENRDRQEALASEFSGETARSAELSETIARAAKRLAEREAELAKVEAGAAAGEQDLETSKGDLIELLNIMAGTRNELAGLEGEIGGFKRRAEQLAQAADAEQARLTDHLARLADLDNKTAEKRRELAADEQAVRERTEGLQRLENSLAAERKTLEQVSSDRQAKQSRHKALSELQQHFEGYQKGVREVLLAAGKGEASCRDVCGVVAELLKVPAQYETAIEVALGGSLQNLVTNTDTGAKAAIGYLKKHKLGRATFLPLNTVKAQTLRPDDLRILELPGVIGLASRLIQCEDRYRIAVENLLGRIVVVDNLDNALLIARKTGFRLRLVTLEGDLLNPGGSLTGGAYHQRGSSLLARSRELEELEQALAKLTAAVEECQAAEQLVLAELARNKTETAELEARVQEGRIAAAELERDVLQARAEKQRLERSALVQTLEKEQVSEEIGAALERQTTLQARLAVQETEYARSRQKTEEMAEDARRTAEACRVLLEEMTEDRVKLAALRQEEQGLAQSLERYHQERARLSRDLESKNAETAQILERQAALRGEEETLRRTIREQALDLQAKEAVLADFRAAKAELTAHWQELEKEAKKAQQSVHSLNQELHQVELKQARLEAEIEAGLSRLWDEFQLSYEQALLEKKELPSRRAAAARINELKANINALGVVNHAAVEEYARVKERYGFLLQQSTDLEQAKTSLYRVISEMNQIMTERFAAAYEAIKVNFSEVFAALFGGGRAELVLTDEKDLLETGIDIVAQPPAKKAQHLSLLSGGERALTAIALLFAILKVKPSPFCVLDEIEASLDEANVRRFADFVREFSQNTQFIVVTHRKGTMEVADVLYGVTMDDTGVSKVVSMKFAGQEPELQPVHSR